MTHLVWFRTDLRAADNPALYRAAAGDVPVRAVYIACPGQWQRHNTAPRQQAFIRRNLQSLAERLAALAIPLDVLEADTFAEVPGVLQRWVTGKGIRALFCNRECGVNEAARDAAVEAALALPLHRFDGDVVLPPGSVLNQQGAMYRVFTPFARAWLQNLQRNSYVVYPEPQPRGDACAVPAIDFRGSFADCDDWPAGENAAQAQLQAFCQQRLEQYAQLRDYPASAQTSGLSPYLALGVLSPRQCLAAIEQALGSLPLSRGESGFSWLNELIWREFYRHLMAAFPGLSRHQPFKAETRALQWRDDHAGFAAWCRGETGFPIVDAAMRCLNRSGWMHNRLRMVVASFLTKDLRVDWRRGEAYFMSQLLDGDFASNNGGWQWAAGTGADAAPYFRVFNPTAQGKKFDPDGCFIRRWLPELADVPLAQLHTPHSWLCEQGRGGDYPPPLVDHARARREAVAMFEALKE